MWHSQVSIANTIGVDRGGRDGRRDAAVVTAEAEPVRWRLLLLLLCAERGGGGRSVAREQLELTDLGIRIGVGISVGVLALRARRHAPPQRPREAEVGQLQVAVLVDQHVLRLQVAAQKTTVVNLYPGVYSHEYMYGVSTSRDMSVN